MQQNIYTIYDVASGAYGRPFFCQADREAMRSFTDISVDAEHPVGQHPSDYTLFRIGTYNDNTGIIEGKPPEKILTALEAISASQTVDKQQLQLLDGEIGNAAAS